MAGYLSDPFWYPLVSIARHLCQPPCRGANQGRNKRYIPYPRAGKGWRGSAPQPEWPFAMRDERRALAVAARMATGHAGYGLLPSLVC
jgi:hypothetical protein